MFRLFMIHQCVRLFDIAHGLGGHMLEASHSEEAYSILEKSSDNRRPGEMEFGWTLEGDPTKRSSVPSFTA